MELLCSSRWPSLALALAPLALRASTHPPRAEARARLDATLAGPPPRGPGRRSWRSVGRCRLQGRLGGASRPDARPPRRRPRRGARPARVAPRPLCVALHGRAAGRRRPSLRHALARAGTHRTRPRAPSSWRPAPPGRAGWSRRAIPGCRRSISTRSPPGEVRGARGHARDAAALWRGRAALTVSETVSGRDVVDPSEAIQDFDRRAIRHGLAIDGTRTRRSGRSSVHAGCRADDPDGRRGELRASRPDAAALGRHRRLRDRGGRDRDRARRGRRGSSPRPRRRARATRSRWPSTCRFRSPATGPRSRRPSGPTSRRTPLAGMPVTAVLRASDDAGQAGEGEARFVLPARPFYEPVAAALVEQRRDLFWSRANRPRAGAARGSYARSPGRTTDPGTTRRPT